MNVVDYRYWRDLRSTWLFGKGLCRVPRNYYLDIIKHYKPNNFLDLGCGLGETYRLFRRNRVGLHYEGIDVIPNFIEICRKRYPEAAFKVGRIQEIPHPTNSFDMVSCRCVLEHLPDPDLAIKEMARVSAGTVVIVWFKWPGKADRYRYKKAGYWENKYSRDRMLDVISSVNLTLKNEIIEQRHLVWVLE